MIHSLLLIFSMLVNRLMNDWHHSKKQHLMLDGKPGLVFIKWSGEVCMSLLWLLNDCYKNDCYKNDGYSNGFNSEDVIYLLLIIRLIKHTQLESISLLKDSIRHQTSGWIGKKVLENLIIITLMELVAQ